MTHARGDSGFTLIEVLVSMVIMIIGLLSVVMMQMVAIKGNVLGNEMTEAAVISDSYITNFRQMPWSDSYLTNGSHAAVTSAGATGTVYSTAWTVADTDLNGDGAADYKDIALTTTWTSPSGFSKAYSFRATKCNPALGAGYASKGNYFDYCNR